MGTPHLARGPSRVQTQGQIPAGPHSDRPSEFYDQVPEDSRFPSVPSPLYLHSGAFVGVQHSPSFVSPAVSASSSVAPSAAGSPASSTPSSPLITPVPTPGIPPVQMMPVLPMHVPSHSIAPAPLSQPQDLAAAAKMVSRSPKFSESGLSQHHKLELSYDAYSSSVSEPSFSASSSPGTSPTGSPSAIPPFSAIPAGYQPQVSSYDQGFQQPQRSAPAGPSHLPALDQSRSAPTFPSQGDNREYYSYSQGAYHPEVLRQQEVFLEDRLFQVRKRLEPYRMPSGALEASSDGQVSQGSSPLPGMAYPAHSMSASLASGGYHSSS